MSQLRRDFANSFRVTATLDAEVSPKLLEQAAERIYSRFPTVFAGFRPGFFGYSLFPAPKAPDVQPDTGLLRTMEVEEIQRGPYRILYSGRAVSIELFHALTDGYGAIAIIRRLLAEYLYLRYGTDLPERDEGATDAALLEEEARDACPGIPPSSLKPPAARYAYQLPCKDRDWQIKTASAVFDTQDLLAAARKNGASLTTFLTCLMSETIMELQEKKSRKKKLPVQIMVPVNLRKLFPSKTMRNFVMYLLPSMEPSELQLSRTMRMEKLQSQMKTWISRDYLGPQVARNIRLQHLPAFRMTPWFLKRLLLKMVCHFWGESNSSITLTNMGVVSFSPELERHIHGMEVLLTPRSKSPYNCG